MTKLVKNTVATMFYKLKQGQEIYLKVNCLGTNERNEVVLTLSKCGGCRAVYYYCLAGAGQLGVREDFDYPLKSAETIITDYLSAGAEVRTYENPSI